jgi:hypothetical protein
MRLSHRIRFGDSVLRILTLRPHRCQFCRRRFYLLHLDLLRAIFSGADDRPVLDLTSPDEAKSIAAAAGADPAGQRGSPESGS